MIPVFSPLTGLAGVVRSLFSAGEPGVWYDPSDLSTMYQDAAGTIPVTAVGQPVGLMLDKSKNGVEINVTKRVNLLMYTEQFDKSAWVTTNATITANTSATTDPIGGNTADKLTETTVGSAHYVRVSGFPVVNGTSYVFSCFAKAAERSIIFLDCFDTVKSFGVSFNLLTGTVSGTRTGAGAVTPTITSVGNGWYRCQIVFTATATGTSSYWAQVGTLLVAGDYGDSNLNYAGDGTSGVFIWGADLRLSSEASTLPVYQRRDANWPSTIPGNHATQTTTASRPVLSARYNLLEKTENFAVGGWGEVYAGTVSENQVISPVGNLNADVYTENADYAEHTIYRNISLSAGISYKFSCYYKKPNNASRLVILRFSAGSINSWSEVYFNLNTLTTYLHSWCYSASVVDIGNGWYRCEAIFKELPSAATVQLAVGFRNVYVGDGTSSVAIWGADLRVANESSLLPPYQRVNTATDYDTAGFPYYLLFDGVDDFLVTGNINFSATDKMTVFAGLRRLSNGTSTQMVIEFSRVVDSYNGSFFLVDEGSAKWFRSKGTLQVDLKLYGYQSPQTVVITCIADISTDVCKVIVNNSSVENNSNQGQGNYGAYPLYLGSRDGQYFRFNGRLYGLIVRGAQTDDAHLTHAEKYLAYKSGVSL